MMSPRARNIERAVAALLVALVLWYYLSERTPETFLFTWCKSWTAQILVVIAAGVALVLSYSRDLARPLELLRRVVVIGGASLVLALVGIESALRLADHPRFEERDNSGRHAPDPDVGHVYVANHTQVLQTREFSVEWKSNAQGVRGERDFGPKSPGVTRILCVGDSFTACDQVPYAQSWPAVLEAELSKRLTDAQSERKVEVVNCGFPGFSTANEAAWITKFAGAFEPDIVLVATTPNDLSENPFPLQYAVRDGALVSATATESDLERIRHRRHWWCLPGVVERSMLAQRFDASQRLRTLLGRAPFHHVEAYQATLSEKAVRLYELADKSMLAAAEAAEKLGARFGLVVIPYRTQLVPLAGGLDGDAYGRHWLEFTTANGITPFVDNRAAFIAHGDLGALYWAEDNHCTAEGYALVARTTAEALWELRTQLEWTP